MSNCVMNEKSGRKFKIMAVAMCIRIGFMTDECLFFRSFVPWVKTISRIKSGYNLKRVEVSARYEKRFAKVRVVSLAY